MLTRVTNGANDSARTIKYVLMYLCLFNSSKVFGGIYSDYFIVTSSIITICSAIYLGIKGNAKASWLFYCAILWILLISIKYGYLQVSSIAGLIVKLTYAYFLILILKKEFIKFYVNSVYYLAVLSIIFYAVGLVFPSLYRILYSVLYPIGIFSSDRVAGFSFWVYNVHLLDFSRNSGFMWEPGAYACILNLAIFLNIVKSELIINKKTVILIIALVTTFSTTGYLGIIPTLFFIVYNSNISKRAYYTIILVIVGLIFLDIPFVASKIEKQYHNNFVRNKLEKDIPVPDRFLSLKYDLEQFKKNIFIGTGPSRETRFEGYSVYAGSTVGISDFMVKYGFYGIFFLLINLIVSSKTIIGTENKLKGWWLFVLLFLLNSSSEVFTDILVAWCIQLYHLKDGLFKRLPNRTLYLPGVLSR